MTVALIVAALVLGGCSTRFAYRQLDLLVPWYVGDYVTLDRNQKRLLDLRLGERLTWHCSSQVGAYAALLRDLATRVARDEALSADELEAFLQRGEAFWRTLMVAITPDAQALLAELDAEQIDQLAAAFALRNREARVKFIDGPPEQRRAQQIERMEKRMQAWFGRLQPEQRQRIAEWSAALAPTTEQWLENRADWQTALLAAIAERRETDFAARLRELLTSPEAGWTASYRAGVAHNRALTLRLVAEVFNTANAQQRSHLRAEILDWAEQFEQMACAAPAAPAVRQRSAEGLPQPV